MSTTTTTQQLRVSEMAENIIGSEILKLAADVNEMTKRGIRVYNYTVGDFDPKIFPIPAELNNEIIAAYQAGHTNYPAANGMADLRQATARFIEQYQGLKYSPEEFLIAGGARPLIYGIFQTVVDPGDKVIFPIPSWNNNHYCHLSRANGVFVETKAENNFMPTAEELRPHLKGASLLALCSPLNPTGTVFTKEQLEEICDMILAENLNRGEGEKPLYLMYDQIYWVLTHGTTQHYDPVSLRPAMRDYTIFVDGLSKAFAATGVRVGWTFGPQRIVDKMKAILGHIGAWAPKAEQVASGKYMSNGPQMEAYLTPFKQEVVNRLDAFYKGFMELKNEGHAVDAIAPQAAIYLTVKFALHGKTIADGRKLATTKDITAYLLEEAKLAIVPFSAFGASENSPWYRISVGTCTLEEITEACGKLKVALAKLS